MSSDGSVIDVNEETKEEDEDDVKPRTDSSPLSVGGPSSSPFSANSSSSPTTAAMASVQAALAALQAGQMSLNQVVTLDYN